MLLLLSQVLVAAQQALEVLMLTMPPLRCVDILAHKLPSEAATSSGTAVDGEVLCATIRCLQVGVVPAGWPCCMVGLLVGGLLHQGKCCWFGQSCVLACS